MEAVIEISGKSYRVNLNQALDISIPLRAGAETVNCFYAPLLDISPVVMGDFTGSVDKGSPVNFMNVRLNPHGNGTHTECVGHISREAFSLNQCLKNFHFLAKLDTIWPEKLENGDRVIRASQLAQTIGLDQAEALVLRTAPNENGKLLRHYSGTNPPYLEPEAVELLVEAGVRHLLVDLPSVDREEDGGRLAAHKAWWRYPGTEAAGRLGATITELVYVPDHLPDGWYLLNLQITSLEMDASPSKPVLYFLEAK